MTESEKHNFTPRRYQRQRNVQSTIPAAAIYVGRPTKWGNPYTVKEHGEIAAEMYESALRAAVDDPWGAPNLLEFRIIAESLEELRGKDLVCWCAPGAPCHADVLLEFANG